jgi:outer membrane receptor for ferrienterochelin and colicin
MTPVSYEEMTPVSDEFQAQVDKAGALGVKRGGKLMNRKGHSRPKLSLALGASLAVLASMTGAAWAQDAVKEEEEIVITGFRASLAQAIEIKREETSAVDAIVAEDIADFPDLNLSESIQRIPGVAITRSNGEGRNISVRGFQHPGEQSRQE